MGDDQAVIEYRLNRLETEAKEDRLEAAKWRTMVDERLAGMHEDLRLLMQRDVPGKSSACEMHRDRLNAIERQLVTMESEFADKLDSINRRFQKLESVYARLAGAIAVLIVTVQIGLTLFGPSIRAAFRLP